MKNKKLKIAFLNIYNGVVNRGAETFVKELASRLADKYEITVFQSGEPLGDEKYCIVKVPVKWDWGKKSGVGALAAFLFIDYWNRQIFKFSLRTFPKIIKGRFDVVIPVNGGWMPALMRICTWLYRGKMVISGQSGMGWDDRNNLWCFPDTFAAISSFAMNWAKHVNPFIRSIYIPNGVNLDKFKSQDGKYNISLKSPIVLCVGALTLTKRIDLVIKAVTKLKDVSLLVVGDGDLRDELVRLGKELLGERFQLIKVPYREMPEVYRVADIFTIPSAPYYSFEIVLAEAMATGLGVVANDDLIRREIVGNAGILVDPTNIDNYARALEKALKTNWEDKPRRQAEKFSWDIISDKYRKLFDEL